MAYEMIRQNGPWTVTAAEALAANTLVTLDTAGKVVNCGATGTAIGWVAEDVASGALATVRPLLGRVLLKASAAIAIGDFVKTAASGKIAPEATVTTRTVATLGQACQAASAYGDLIAVYVG